MKILLFILLLVTLGFSKSEETCYTVQLLSRNNTPKNLDQLVNIGYPEGCKLMQIGTNITLRCGCYEKVAAAKEHLQNFTKEYKGAVVASTYKYRFDENATEKTEENKTIQNDIKTKTTPPKQLEPIATEEVPQAQQEVLPQEPAKPAKPVKAKEEYEEGYLESSDDEELKLMVQVFLYKSDLENAYKVASLGYEKNPKSYYWNQKMAEISKWTNRSARSMKHLRFMYEVKYDRAIEDELIEYGSEAYQYEEIEPMVVNRARREPNEKNIDLLILVYKKIGSPEKVVDVLESEYLKDKSNRMLLTKALELSLEIGDLDLAKKYVLLLEQNKPFSQKDALFIARYYYILNDIERAYACMSDTSEEHAITQEESVKF
ncbi:MAG: hypothetical protein WBK95_11355, partial [Sulfurimonas sp.]